MDRVGLRHQYFPVVSTLRLVVIAVRGRPLLGQATDAPLVLNWLKFCLFPGLDDKIS